MRKITFNPNRLKALKPGEAFYFAYSTDMDIKRMEMHCPHPKGACIATLRDHCLVTDGHGYINLIPKPHAHVQGILWKITAENQEALDQRYGVAEGFRTKKMVTVETGVDAYPQVEALAYVSEHGPFATPSMRRLHITRSLAAAEKHQLDQDTLDQLGNLELHEDIVSQVARKDYVCETCFHRIGHCTCSTPPEHLINVDAGVQDVVRVLNEKGYTTRYSCEGHNGRQGPSVMLLPQMPNGVEGHPLPEGLYWDRKWNMVRCDPSPFYTDREVALWQQERLDALLAWAQELPEREKNARGSYFEDMDPERKAACRSHLVRSADAYKQYRCSRCLELAEECTCERHLSWRLFLIDADMLPFVNALEEHRNYRYLSGCAGHKRLSEIYLEFSCWSRICHEIVAPEVLFPNLPQEFTMEVQQDSMDDQVVVRVANPDDTLAPEEFQVERRRLLDKLLAWYESLPPNNYGEIGEPID